MDVNINSASIDAQSKLIAVDFDPFAAGEQLLNVPVIPSQILTADISQSFDLIRGLLFRSQIIRLANRPRPSLRTFNAACLDWDLDLELVNRLRQLGTKAGASFATKILAEIEVWLHRLTGQNDLVVAQVPKNLPNSGSSNQLKFNMTSIITAGYKGQTEAILLAIWSQVLGQSPIDIDENFFELGGNSILIIQVATEIRQQLGGIEIPVVKLFQYPTIAQLAAYLNSVDSTPQPDRQLKNRAQQQKSALDARRRRQSKF